ncbi:hypothetical protein C8T65DRAFT_712618 [Cerioporus squamosus]|nr:hypothetical protein C8T65DRAFT_712618 [Cerioporus squamosus]
MNEGIALWEKAWGKSWPHQSTGTVSMADLSPDEGISMAIETDDDDSVGPDDGRSTQLEDILVIRPEYVRLRETMETGYLQDAPAIVGTGNPGVGKTVCLLYLLLCRLERKLPTAIYLMYRKESWALSDSNYDIVAPCAAFRRSRARLIHASSPRLDQWKGWMKYKRFSRVIISDLPRPLEIGAIMKQLGLNTAEAYRFISKWGPCTRTILDLLRRSPRALPEAEAQLEYAARRAAAAICANPATFGDNLVQSAAASEGSTLLFISPYRPRDPDTSELCCFDSLSSHALTRAGPAWNFERRVHGYLCSDSPPLAIFNEHDSSTMQLSQRLLAGRAIGLARCGAYPSFYWLPLTTTYPGVDGVLADNGNVYAVWDHFNCQVLDKRVWHVVFVTDSEGLAREQADKFAHELEDFTLGRAKIRVQVWGCVLPRP